MKEDEEQIFSIQASAPPHTHTPFAIILFLLKEELEYINP
jgi:hypothetical protein